MLALIGLALLAALLWLPDLLPEESELVPVEPPGERPVPIAEPLRDPEPPAPPEVAEAEPEPAEPLPPLSRSDAWVRTEAAGLSDQAAFRQGLQAEDLVRRFVAAVDEVSDGGSPRSHLEFLAPRGRFRTVFRDGRLVTDPRSFRRYDAVAKAVASLDAGRCVRLYRRAGPLVEKAFVDLGYEDARFRERIEAALALLLTTPVPRGDEELFQPGVYWEYRDESLEGLEPAQKQLLRMGPENVRRVQAKLRELASALEVPER
ncbi:MAG: DUF3014 domain-containing protein [Myxococcota bacterium]